MKVLKNKSICISLILLLGALFTGCSNNSEKLDNVPDIEFSEVPEVNYSTEEENEYLNEFPDVDFSMDEEIDYLEGEENAGFLNDMLDKYRDKVN